MGDGECSHRDCSVALKEWDALWQEIISLSTVGV
jgi:hypothetical protein